jgi:hypothetical protein
MGTPGGGIGSSFQHRPSHPKMCTCPTIYELVNTYTPYYTFDEAFRLLNGAFSRVGHRDRRDTEIVFYGQARSSYYAQRQLYMVERRPVRGIHGQNIVSRYPLVGSSKLDLRRIERYNHNFWPS